MNLLGISGSLRKESHNTSLLRAAAELTAPGAQLKVYSGLREIPPYDQDIETDPAPAAVAALRDAIAAADAVVFSTPEYNHSIPGQLKNALDWLSRQPGEDVFRDKPVLVVGASAGIFGAVWAQAELRKVLGAMGAKVVEGELPIGQAHEAFTDTGALVDEDQVEALTALLDQLRDLPIAA